MCLAVPGEVVELFDDDVGHGALVDVLGVRRRVDVGLLEDDELAVGDWVLVHVGFAMSRIDPTEAAELLAMLQESARTA